MKHIANIITVCRIPLSISLLFIPAFGLAWLTVYMLCGLSDMLDGYVARKTHSDSAYGSKLDSVADIVFVAVCAIVLVKQVNIAAWMWLFAGIIALVKIINIISSLVYRKRVMMLHTTANKIAGFSLFIWLPTVCLVPLNWSVPVLCSFALFAAIQEGHYIRTKHSH
jgi:phosphatidylglycerophosphate synthase